MIPEYFINMTSSTSDSAINEYEEEDVSDSDIGPIIIAEEDIDDVNRIDDISIPHPLPKLLYKNINRSMYITYDSINNQYFNNTDIDKLRTSILTTHSRYVYPTVFVQFIIPYTTYRKKRLVFSNKHMHMLQVWSNQLRSMLKTSNTDEINYVTYIIASRALEFIRIDMQ